MPKTLNKKQKKALDYLIYDLDELDNKPRRFFSSLRKIAEEFIPAKDYETKEHKNKIIDSIDEYEEYYYLFLNIPDLMNGILEKSRKVKRELCSRNKEHYKASESEIYAYQAGVKDATNLITKEIISDLTELNH